MDVVILERVTPDLFRGRRVRGSSRRLGRSPAEFFQGASQDVPCLFLCLRQVFGSPAVDAPEARSAEDDGREEALGRG